jgi:hypothetical protein
VVKEDRVKEFKLELPLTFAVTSQKELNYALSLMELYDTIVRPFLSKHERDLAGQVDSFDRLFFISGDLNNHVVGKTIHNTRRSIDLFLHFSIAHMDLRKRKSPLIVHKMELNDFVVPRELAHLSHFKRNLDFDSIQSHVPFSAFNFDLNYFKCYMIPLLLEKM